ncbi:DUF3060 domain-containing protein [Cellulomonas fimi]|uniref:DUF3060 domain-containing protein n=1 Tax=Cellulomonas fimi TaxID=1708 RepID=UPI0011AEA4D7|nr:DUF3060 domain-containing protein [Cellulomonas fimi]
MRRRAVVLGVALAATLCGCSAEIVRDDDPAGAADGGGQSDMRRPPSDAGTTDDGSAPDDGTPAATGQGGDGHPAPPDDETLDRAGLAAEATQHVTCGGGDLVLTSVGTAVAVDDACATLTVAASDAAVVAGEVERLVVAGAGVRVVVARAGSVQIDAADVRVAWEDGTPQVDDHGAANVYGPVGTVGLDGGAS